jgi:hypothetical protein
MLSQQVKNISINEQQQQQTRASPPSKTLWSSFPQAVPPVPDKPLLARISDPDILKYVQMGFPVESVELLVKEYRHEWSEQEVRFAF